MLEEIIKHHGNAAAKVALALAKGRSPAPTETIAKASGVSVRHIHRLRWRGVLTDKHVTAAGQHVTAAGQHVTTLKPPATTTFSGFGVQTFAVSLPVSQSVPLRKKEKEPKRKIYRIGPVVTGINNYILTPNSVPGERYGEGGNKTENSAPKTPPQKSPAARKIGGRLPEDWTLPDKWFDWVLLHCDPGEIQLTSDDIKVQADWFKDYWHAKTGANATKLDWFATWRNWIRKASEQKARFRWRQQGAPAWMDEEDPMQAFKRARGLA